MWNLFKETQQDIHIFYNFSTLTSHRFLKPFILEDQGLFILHTQYHCCWCPGDTRSQGISSHGIDLAIPEYSRLSTRGVNKSYSAMESCYSYSIVNSLWPSDAMWWHRSGSTLAHVMACCLSAPSHYLIQCWLIISKVQVQINEKLSN